MPRDELLDDSLRQGLESTVELGECIYTIVRSQPNWVVEIEPRGVWVETRRSRASSTGPQLVPAWMLNLAYRELVAARTLTPARLQDELNVMRSAAVCALLAQLPEVEVAHDPEPSLRYALPRAAS